MGLVKRIENYFVGVETWELQSYNIVTSAPAVGGTIFPVNKLGLVMPYIITAAVMLVASVSLAIWKRKDKIQQQS
jgi:hypothetical protein